MSDHEDVVQRISDAFSNRGLDVRSHGNNLPTNSGRDGAIYRPDLIVRNSEGDIVWLVEVETNQPGKSVVGAAMLADICVEEEIKKRPQREKPGMMFIFYRASAKLKLAEKRLDAPKRQRRIRNLEPILILDEASAKKKILEPAT